MRSAVPKDIVDGYCRELFDALDHGFCTVEVLFDDARNALDYRFVAVNATFEAQTGLGHVVGRRMSELAPGHEHHWFHIYGEVARNGESKRFEAEAAALGRWYDVYAFRVGAPHENLVGILFNDITARKRAEQAVEVAEREAERARRTKDEFLAMLGHELRNPLAPMVTALQLMRLRRPSSRMQDVLERQVQHLTRMVDDLLDVSRITRGRLELVRRPIELAEVVLTALELAGPLLEQHRNLVQVETPRRGLVIDADRGRMAQVVANLLTNAAKYSHAGSRIEVHGARHGERITLIVSDQGSGLAPDVLETIFEPFVQQPQSLERATGGLGLGLAIVRNLVTAHDGTVHARSLGLGRGSQFVVDLPAAEVPASAQPAEALASPRVNHSQPRVLIVDDNHDAAEMLQGALEQMGYAVDVAFDGPMALETAARVRPAIVLLDIGLPVMNGYEVARRLRAAQPSGLSMRLLALTGYGADIDRQRSRAAGFEHHLVKPIDLERLDALRQERP